LKRHTYVSVFSVLALLVAAAALAPNKAALTATSFSQSAKAHAEPDQPGEKSNAETTNGNGNEPLGGPIPPVTATTLDAVRFAGQPPCEQAHGTAAMLTDPIDIDRPRGNRGRKRAPLEGR